MRLGRPTVAVILTEAERMQLESLARRSRTAAQVARRARVVLACAAGHDNKTVARRLRLSPATVGKWRARLCAIGSRDCWMSHDRSTAHGDRCASGAVVNHDPGNDPARRHALEHAVAC